MARSPVAPPALLAALLLLSVPAAAVAQSSSPILEVHGGIGLPAFDLADRVDPGPAFGLELGYRLSDRVSLVAGGDVELLSGEAGALVDHPDVNAWHYGVGIEAGLVDPARTYWRLRAGVGAGAATFDVSGGGSATDPALWASLELGRELSEEMELAVGLRPWLAFTGEGGLGPDPRGGGVGGDGGDTLWSFPLTAALRLTF